MRSARLTIAPADRLAVVLVAHGSRDPRAAAATSALVRAVARQRPRWDVHATYLDHAGPRPLDVLAGLAPGRRAVLVPLLLTAAYHGRVDVPAVAEEAARLPLSVTLADVLGPVPGPGRRVVPPLLVDGLVRRLGEADSDGASSGPRAGASGVGGRDAVGSGGGLGAAGSGVGGPDAVVLAAAGTRNAAARETISWAAEALSARLSLPVAVAYASAAAPLPGAAVAALRSAGASRVGMAAYFLAPGLLYDTAVRSAREAGAVTVAAPLTDAGELARLVASRVSAAEARLVPAAA